MTSQVPENFSEEEIGLGARIFDLIVGRVLKKVYLSLDENLRKSMEEVFSSNDEDRQDEFIKKHAPDFRKFFEEEAGRIEQELETEIRSRL